MRIMNSMAVDRPRVISAGCRAGPVGPCGLRTSLLRVHGPIIIHMNFHGLIGATSSRGVGLTYSGPTPKNLGIGRSRTLADDIPGGAIGMVYLLRGKKNIQTSQPLRTSLCQPGLGDVIFGRHSGGGHWTGFPGAWDANLAIPANTLCAGLAWDVGPASCSFLSKRESEAGSSETTHFARGPCENHPCRYSCLCVPRGTKFPDTSR